MLTGVFTQSHQRHTLLRLYINKYINTTGQSDGNMVTWDVRVQRVSIFQGPAVQPKVMIQGSAHLANVGVCIGGHLAHGILCTTPLRWFASTGYLGCTNSCRGPGHRLPTDVRESHGSTGLTVESSVRLWTGVPLYEPLRIPISQVGLRHKLLFLSTTHS